MKRLFLRFQWEFWTVYYGLAALLLVFGLLLDEDDLTKLFVGAGVVCAFSAGCCWMKVVVDRRRRQGGYVSHITLDSARDDKDAADGEEDAPSSASKAAERFMF